MCGRFSFAAPLDELLDAFGVAAPEWDERPRYNIAPGQDILTIVQDGAGRRLERARWGLVPSWARDPGVGYRMINARAETLFEKPAFRSAALRRRCLVLADGFFEWKRLDARRKQPYRIVLRDRPAFAIAGLYDIWTDAGGNPLRTVTLVTTSPNDLVAPIHDRMPAILRSDHETPWMNPGLQQREAVAAMLMPYPAGAMRAYPVSSAVNATQNDGPECIAPKSGDSRHHY